MRKKKFAFFFLERERERERERLLDDDMSSYFFTRNRTDQSDVVVQTACGTLFA